MNKIIFLLLTAIVFCSAFAEHPSAAPLPATFNDTTPAYQMKQYWLVFLLKGTNRGQDSATAENIQEGHMANIERLAKQGVIILAGPMGDNKDIRGIFIMDAKDSATAAGFIKTDPAVIAGRLRFEIQPWWTAKGTYEFK